MSVTWELNGFYPDIKNNNNSERNGISLKKHEIEFGCISSILEISPKGS